MRTQGVKTGIGKRNVQDFYYNFATHPQPTLSLPFEVLKYKVSDWYLLGILSRWIIQKYFLIWLVTTKIDLIIAGYLPTYTIHHTWWRQCLLSLTSNIINRIRCYVKEVLIIRFIGRVSGRCIIREASLKITKSYYIYF